MLKTDYPIYFDDTEIAIRDRQWNISYSNVSKENQTEGGTDDVEYIRFNKRTISAQFRCTDVWAAVLVAFNSHPSITVKYYDVETKTYIESVVRMEGLSVAKLPRSEISRASNGIYTISFRLLEY